MPKTRSPGEMKILNKTEDKQRVQLNLRIIPVLPVMIDDLIEDFRQQSGGQLKLDRNQLLTLLVGTAHKKMQAEKNWWGES